MCEGCNANIVAPLETGTAQRFSGRYLYMNCGKKKMECILSVFLICNSNQNADYAPGCLRSVEHNR